MDQDWVKVPSDAHFSNLCGLAPHGSQLRLAAPTHGVNTSQHIVCSCRNTSCERFSKCFFSNNTIIQANTLFRTEYLVYQKVNHVLLYLKLRKDLKI